MGVGGLVSWFRTRVGGAWVDAGDGVSVVDRVTLG
jgi:hypothetical protein